MLGRIFFSLGIRMVIGLVFAAFAGIASLAGHARPENDKPVNPWSKDYAASDSGRSGGWGRTASSRGDGHRRQRSEMVYVDKDGVEHGAEDLKAYDPDSIVIHDTSGRVVDAPR